MENRRERLFLKFVALNVLHRGGQDLFCFQQKDPQRGKFKVFAHCHGSKHCDLMSFFFF